MIMLRLLILVISTGIRTGNQDSPFRVHLARSLIKCILIFVSV